jgi:Fe-S cluster assembly protein SufB
MSKDEDKIIEEATSGEYKYGFVSDIESDMAQKGLTENTVRFISEKKNEPNWLLEWRLKAFKMWEKMEEPDWAHISYVKPDFQDIIYYAAPKPKKKYESLDEVDPEILKTFEKLGVP